METSSPGRTASHRFPSPLFVDRRIADFFSIFLRLRLRFWRPIRRPGRLRPALQSSWLQQGHSWREGAAWGRDRTKDFSRHLQPGSVYRYQVRAEFMRDGKATSDEQTVELTAGDTHSITLGGALEPKVADVGTAAQREL